MSKLKNFFIVPFQVWKQIQNPVGRKINFFYSFYTHYLLKLFNINYYPFKEYLIKTNNCIFRTREKTIDFWMFWKDYEVEIFDKLNKLKSTGTFIDVGANLGRYSIIMARNGWRVYSFEPVSSNFEQLKINSNINSLNKKIKTLNFALGSKNENKKIYFNKFEHGEASVKFKIGDSFEIITIKKLDSLKIILKKPAIMKIDVEGFELEVLKGAKKFILKNKPLLIIEIWNKKTEEFLKMLNYVKNGEIWYPKN